MTIIMLTRGWRGAIILGIIFSTIFATILNYAYDKTSFAQGIAVIPSKIVAAPDFSLLGQFNFGAFSKLGVTAAILWIFSLMLSDFFDTMGTLVGVGEQAGYLDNKGHLKKLNRLLLIDSLAAVAGGAASASSATTYIESGAGVAQGGRTGMVGITVGVLFLLAMFFSPIAGIVPANATAPALIIVGYLMMATLTAGETMAEDEEGEGLVKKRHRRHQLRRHRLRPPRRAHDDDHAAHLQHHERHRRRLPLLHAHPHHAGQGQGDQLDAVDRLCRLPHLLPRAAAAGQGLGLSRRLRPPQTASDEGAGRRRAARPFCYPCRRMSVVLLLIALAIILASAELFTNGVEWFGRRYELGEGAVGSILAAVGTALPETLVPIIAIVFTGGAAADDIGIGAILGAPFMLASLAMVVTATAVVVFHWRGRRPLAVTVNEGVMRRDLSHFLIAYALAMVAGVIHVRALHYGLAAGLHALLRLLRVGDAARRGRPRRGHQAPLLPPRPGDAAHVPDLPADRRRPPRHHPRRRDLREGGAGAQQDAGGRAADRVAAHHADRHGAAGEVQLRALDPPAQGHARAGQHHGAMVFQSTFPVSVGLVFATWQLTAPALVAGLLALFSGTVFYLTLRIRHTLTWWSLGGAGSVYFAYLSTCSSTSFAGYGRDDEQHRRCPPGRPCRRRA